MIDCAHIPTEAREAIAAFDKATEAANQAMDRVNRMMQIMGDSMALVVDGFRLAYERPLAELRGLETEN